MNKSEIVLNNGSTTFAGPDAVNLFRAISLKSSLSLYAKCGMRPTRMVTPTMMLQMATEYTGKKYKRSQHAQAAADMNAWIQTMKTALPITDEREEELDPEERRIRELEAEGMTRSDAQGTYEAEQIIARARAS